MDILKVKNSHLLSDSANGFLFFYFIINQWNNSEITWNYIP